MTKNMKQTTYEIVEKVTRDPYRKTHVTHYYIHKNGKPVCFDKRIRAKAWGFSDPASITFKALKKWLVGDYVEMVFKNQEDAQATLDGIITPLPKDKVVSKNVVKD